MAGVVDTESEKTLFFNRSSKEHNSFHHPMRSTKPGFKASSTIQKSPSKKAVFEDLVEQGKRALLQCNVHHIFNKIQEQMAQLHGAGYRCLLLWHRPSEDGRQKQTSGWRGFSPSIVELMTVKENGQMELSAYGKMVLETFIAMHMEIIAKENGNIIIDEEAELIEEKEVDLSWYNFDQSQPSPPNSDSDTPMCSNDDLLMQSKNICAEQSKSINKLTSKILKAAMTQVAVKKSLSTPLTKAKSVSNKIFHSPSRSAVNSYSNSNLKQSKSLLPDITSSRITPSPSSSSSSHLSCNSFSLSKASLDTDLNSSSTEHLIEHTSSSLTRNITESSPVNSSELPPSVSEAFHKNMRPSRAQTSPRHKSVTSSEMRSDNSIYKMLSPKVILFKLSKDKISKITSSDAFPMIRRKRGRPRKNHLFVNDSTPAIHSMSVNKRPRLPENQPVLTRNGVEYRLTIAQTTDDWDRVDCPCGKPYHGRPMTLCLICKRWWHDGCAGLKWGKKENAHWVCTNCSENNSDSVTKGET